MSECFEIVRVGFMAFIACCAIRSVGPAYAISLRAEAAKVYSAKQVGSEWVETEEELGIRHESILLGDP